MDGFNIVKELYTSNKQLHENLYLFSTNTNKDMKDVTQQLNTLTNNVSLLLEQQRLILASLNEMKTLDYDKLHATNDILKKI